MATFSLPKKIWVVIAVLICVALVLTVILQVVFAHDRYLAVYLQTGDIYFGKQVGFLGYTLQDVWIIQRGENQGLTLVPLNSAAAWHPSNPLHLNEKEVVFWSYLDPNSQIAQAIAGKITASTSSAALAPQQVQGVPGQISPRPPFVGK